MKRIFIALCICIVSAVSVNAQFTKIGGGLVYGTGVYFHNESSDLSHKTGNPALNLKGIYEISLPLHVSPSVNIFFPRVTEIMEMKQIISAFLFDVDGHYVFNSLSRFEFYGLAGLNITLIRNKWKYEWEEESSDASSETAFGLNIGGGTYMKLTEQLDLFGELKYIVSSRDQFVLTAGVLLNLDWLKKNETKAF